MKRMSNHTTQPDETTSRVPYRPQDDYEAVNLRAWDNAFRAYIYVTIEGSANMPFKFVTARAAEYADQNWAQYLDTEDGGYRWFQITPALVAGQH